MAAGGAKPCCAISRRAPGIPRRWTQGTPLRSGSGLLIGARGPLRRQQIASNGRQLPVEVRTGQPGAPAACPRKVGDERGLQAFVRRLPDEADRASPKRDVIARLDAVELLAKEAAAC